jgi:hypothetical protein
MDAKRPASYALHVEWLESRCLLSGTSPFPSLAGAAPMTQPAAGFDAPVVQITVLPDALFVSVPRSAAPADSPGHAGAIAQPVAPTALVVIGGHDTIFTLTPTADARWLDPHDRDMGFRPLPQLTKDDSHDTTNRDRPTGVPATSSAPGATDATSGGRTEVAARAPAEPTSPPIGRNPAAEGSVTDVAVPADAPPQSPSGSDRAATTPADSDPASAGAPLIPLVSPIAVDPGRSPWRNVLLDPLAGVPAADAIALNLSALSAEADAFLAHLGDLGAEWSADDTWSEYACLAAGVALVGSAYFARSAPPRRTARADASWDRPGPSEDVP